MPTIAPESSRPYDGAREAQREEEARTFALMHHRRKRRDMACVASRHANADCTTCREGRDASVRAKLRAAGRDADALLRGQEMPSAKVERVAREERQADMLKLATAIAVLLAK